MPETATSVLRFPLFLILVVLTNNLDFEDGLKLTGTLGLSDDWPTPTNHALCVLALVLLVALAADICYYNIVEARAQSDNARKLVTLDKNLTELTTKERDHEESTMRMQNKIQQLRGRLQEMEMDFQTRLQKHECEMQERLTPICRNLEEHCLAMSTHLTALKAKIDEEMATRGKELSGVLTAHQEKMDTRWKELSGVIAAHKERFETELMAHDERLAIHFKSLDQKLDYTFRQSCSDWMSKLDKFMDTTRMEVNTKMFCMDYRAEMAELKSAVHRIGNDEFGKS